MEERDSDDRSDAYQAGWALFVTMFCGIVQDAVIRRECSRILQNKERRASTA